MIIQEMNKSSTNDSFILFLSVIVLNCITLGLKQDNLKGWAKVGPSLGRYMVG